MKIYYLHSVLALMCKILLISNQWPLTTVSVAQALVVCEHHRFYVDWGGWGGYDVALHFAEKVTKSLIPMMAVLRSWTEHDGQGCLKSRSGSMVLKHTNRFCTKNRRSWYPNHVMVAAWWPPSVRYSPSS